MKEGNESKNKNEEMKGGIFDDLKKIFRKSESSSTNQKTDYYLKTFTTTLNWLDPFMRFLLIALFLNFIIRNYLDISYDVFVLLRYVNIGYLIYNLILRFLVKSIVIENNNLYYTHTFGVKKVLDIANYNCLIFPIINSLNMVKITDKSGNSVYLNGIKNVNQLREILQSNFNKKN